MAKIQILFLFSVCIAVVYCKRFTKVQDDGNGEGVCKFNGKNYKPDDEWFDSECKKWRCATGSNKNEMLMHGETCENRGPNGESCKVKITPGKNYPECCTNICDENLTDRDRAREEQRRNRDEERRNRDEERRNRDEERRHRDEERRNRHHGRPQPIPSQPTEPKTPQVTPSQEKNSTEPL